MHVITSKEKNKRGCEYCTDRMRGARARNRCKHDECPYHDLDSFDTYEDYFNSQDTAGIAKIFLDL